MTQPTKSEDWILRALFGFPALLGVGLLILGLVATLGWFYVLTFTKIEATITKSEVGYTRTGGLSLGGEGAYYPIIEYEYESKGKLYGGRSRSNFTYHSENRCRRLVGTYPTGTQTHVFYRPSSPQTSVFSRDLSNMALLAFTLFFPLGTFLALLSFRLLVPAPQSRLHDILILVFWGAGAASLLGLLILLSLVFG